MIGGMSSSPVHMSVTGAAVGKGEVPPSGGSSGGEESSHEGSEEDSDAAMSNDTSWVSWFLTLKSHSFFCEVEEEFLSDDFNLTGLNQAVPYYDHALDLILDMDIDLESFSDEQQEIIEASAEVLYGLIHARYINTARGMQRMLDKFLRADFGRCQRVHCHGQPVLPTGLSDQPRRYFVSVFCPMCRELFHPKSSRHLYLDGAYFGTTFPHLFVLSHPELTSSTANQHAYVPRIFGFKIHASSSYYLHAPAPPPPSSHVVVGVDMMLTEEAEEETNPPAQQQHKQQQYGTSNSEQQTTATTAVTRKVHLLPPRRGRSRDSMETVEVDEEDEVEEAETPASSPLTPQTL